MTFWGHISALRGVLVRIAAVVLSLTVVFFIFMHDIFDEVILAPCESNFITYRFFDQISAFFSSFTGEETAPFNVKLINIQLSSQFFVHMSTSFWLALIFSFPFIIYFLWGFIKPALYSNERKGIVKAFFFGNIMFYIGIAIGYYLIFPVSLRFLAGYQLSELIPNQISLDSYMDNFLVMIFLMGVIFEMPLLSWLLSSMGLLNKGFFNKYRRHAIVVLMIVAAIVTPADPFSMLVAFFPLYGLYEFSALFVKPAPKEDEDDDPDDDKDDKETLDYIPSYKSRNNITD